MTPAPVPTLLLAALVATLDPTELQLSLDWTREREPPYPNLVASFRHRKGATLTVGRQFLAAGEDGESLARGNAQALIRMGFRVRREGNTLEASSRRGRSVVHQVYIVQGTVGWVVTLAGTPAQVRLLRRDFLAAVAQVEGG